MKAQRVASPTSRLRSLAGTQQPTLQTQSPWNPVRLSKLLKRSYHILKALGDQALEPATS